MKTNYLGLMVALTGLVISANSFAQGQDGIIAYLKNSKLFVADEADPTKAEAIEKNVLDFKVSGNLLLFRKGSGLYVYKNGALVAQSKELKSSVTDYRVVGDEAAILKGNELYRLNPDGTARLVAKNVGPYYLSGSKLLFLKGSDLYLAGETAQDENKLIAENVRLTGNENHPLVADPNSGNSNGNN